MARPASWRTAEPAARRSASSVSGCPAPSLPTPASTRTAAPASGRPGSRWAWSAAPVTPRTLQGFRQGLGGLGRQRVVEQHGTVGPLSHADDQGVARRLLQVPGNGTKFDFSILDHEDQSSILCDFSAGTACLAPCHGTGRRRLETQPGVCKAVRKASSDRSLSAGPALNLMRAGAHRRGTGGAECPGGRCVVRNIRRICADPLAHVPLDLLLGLPPSGADAPASAATSKGTCRA